MSDAVSWHDSHAQQFADRYQRSPAFREREALWHDLISRFETPGGRILDAGCGSGVMTRHAAQNAGHVFAFDASAAMVELARETLTPPTSPALVTLRQARIGDPCLLEEHGFDLILCSSVLEYLDDWRAGFQWLSAALAPNGVIIFSMPNANSLYRRIEPTLYRMTGKPAYFEHVRARPVLADITTFLSQSGFVIEAQRVYGAAPGLSPICRAIGLAHYADTLSVFACKRA